MLPFSGCPDTSMHFSRKLVLYTTVWLREIITWSHFLFLVLQSTLHDSFIQLWIKKNNHQNKRNIFTKCKGGFPPPSTLASLLISSDILWLNRHHFAGIVYQKLLLCGPLIFSLGSSYVSKILNFYFYLHICLFLAII